MDITCNSTEINRVAAQLGGKPEMITTALYDGTNERITLWELPNGFRAIETNGEPVFEAAESEVFAALAEMLGE